MSNPIACIISDVHYNIQTLPLADVAMRQAIKKANDLQVPLIIAGDLHDTKANMRAECVNAMIKTFNTLEQDAYVLVGNHDKINEKSTEHSLNFLKNEHGNVVLVVDSPGFFNELGAINGNSIHLIPYQYDVEVLRSYLKKVDHDSCLIMHQGLQGSDSGEYIQDKSALTHEDVKDFRVISGHYHARQDIKVGRPRKGAVGLFSYIGNPYTLGFGEANHPEKGFQILNDDGTLEFVPTNLRKHIIWELQYDSQNKILVRPSSNDLLWVKVLGNKEQLSNTTKKMISDNYKLDQDFRLDLIPTDEVSTYQKKTKDMSQNEILDDIIDSKDLSDIKKQELKELWKNL